MTIICEFCTRYLADGTCRAGLDIPKRMTCKEYSPGLRKFCSNTDDFKSAAQLVEMATYFGMKGTELKKVRLMAAQEEESRTRLADQAHNEQPASTGSDGF